MQLVRLHPYLKKFQTNVFTRNEAEKRTRSGFFLRAGIIFISLFVGLVMIQFTAPAIIGNDGYYHIKFAQLMRLEGLKPDFPYLPLTILNSREFYDHHFLFHLAMIPFTFGDLVLGAKWASVTFAAAAFFCVWLLLYTQKIPYAVFWTLGLLVISEAFLYRLSMPRAQSISLAFLALALLVLLKEKPAWLFLIGFLYVWTYNAFPLILVVTLAYLGMKLLLNKKLDLRPFAYAASGVLLGLVINPYFPQNVVFIYHHLAPKLSEATAVSVGNEWFPYRTTQLLENSLPALVLFFAGVFGLGLQRDRMDLRTATSLLLALGFGLMLFESRRFIEYFPAFALIFSAFAFTPLLADLQSYGSNLTIRQAKFFRFLPMVLGVFCLAAAAVWAYPRVESSFSDTRSPERYQEASNFLIANTPPGSRIFQTDWDDFPQLFFHNTHNTYLIGLDPTYLQTADKDLYTLWTEITDGEVQSPSNQIRGLFASQYVLSDLRHEEFLGQAAQDAGLREIYRDEYATIFQVLP